MKKYTIANYKTIALFVSLNLKHLLGQCEGKVVNMLWKYIYIYTYIYENVPYFNMKVYYNHYYYIILCCSVWQPQATCGYECLKYV